MQVGSLVECITPCGGNRFVNGIPTKLMPQIERGEILTVSNLLPADALGTKGIAFWEHPIVIHPITKKQCGSPIDNFRELMPPMEIDIEALIKQPHEQH